MAFDVATGERRWASNELRSFAFFKTVGRAVMTGSLESDLEWRDPSSGEVFAALNGQDRAYPTNAVMLGEAVLVETRDIGNGRDGLRLLRLPNTIAERLKRRN